MIPDTSMTTSIALHAGRMQLACTAATAERPCQSVRAVPRNPAHLNCFLCGRVQPGDGVHVTRPLIGKEAT